MLAGLTVIQTSQPFAGNPTKGTTVKQFKPITRANLTSLAADKACENLREALDRGENIQLRNLGPIRASVMTRLVASNYRFTQFTDNKGLQTICKAQPVDSLVQRLNIQQLR